MEQQHPYKPYIIQVCINNDFISIRDTRYPLNSLPPSGQGRFHRPGQLAYYASSGTPTALAEVCGDRPAQIVPPRTRFCIPSGDYILFDFHQYLKDHPNEYQRFFPNSPNSKDRGWPSCQILRDELETIGCSGTVFNSFVEPRAINIAIWPLNGTPPPESFFRSPNS